MARPIKQGLDYFPLDTNMDDNFELIEAKYGIEGFGVLIKLYQRAYKECGYFYPWTEKEQLLFSKRVNVDNNTVNNIIVDAVTYGIFDKRLYDKGILTSHGMQKRYIEATIRRKEITMFLDIMLISVDDIPVNVGKNQRKIILVDYISTQSKRNEMKRNEIESKEPAAINAPAPVLTFESFAKQCAETWNDLGIKPAFRFTTSAGLTGKEREGFLTSSARYSMDEIIQAMRNYHDIGASAEHEVFPKGYGLAGFLAGGVEKFTDDADPWTRCRKKATGEQTTEERNAMISKIAAEISKPDLQPEPEKFFDDESFADDPHPEPLVFDAKKAMSDIRKMSGRNEARRA